ncbi:hypothetical protein DV737_g5109, partial [Chaetothyriales sp. CBS 132003]
MSTEALQPKPYDSHEVSTVRVVVHALGPVKRGASISYNHWTVSLLSPNSPHSIRLDMQPSGPRNGTLIITELPYLVSTRATAYFDFLVYPDKSVTVGNVKDILRFNGRHRYSMTEHGGCQWWCWNVIKDLSNAAILGPNAGDELWAVLHNNFSFYVPPMQHQIEIGTFY